MSEKILIVDYGSGNIRSVFNALKRVAASHQEVQITQNPADLIEADRLILPGVGAFSECIQKLRNRGWDKALEEFRSLSRPLLGICVGMQVLCESGEEFSPQKGLGWIQGSVKKMSVDVSQLKLPHIGWTRLHARSHPVFENIPQDSRFYFVHSFAVNSTDEIASASYGSGFSAVVASKTSLGAQFHPEKSDKTGLRFLFNFCQWKP